MLPPALLSLKLLTPGVVFVEGVFEAVGRHPCLREFHTLPYQGLLRDLALAEELDDFGVDLRTSLERSKTLEFFSGYPCWDYVPDCLQHIVVHRGFGYEDPQELIGACRPGQLSNNLRNVSLAGCAVDCLGPTLGRLLKLESLDASGNRIAAIHGSLGQLPRLSHLSLASNGLTRLPEGLTALTGLTSLDLSQNPGLCELGGLTCLGKLRELHVSPGVPVPALSDSVTVLV